MQSSEEKSYLWLLLFVSFLVFSYKIPSGDHWTHIAQGLYILDTGSVPAVDVHSFTYAGTPWVNWEWLHNVIQAFFWRTSEDFGVIFFRILQVLFLLFSLFGLFVCRTRRHFLSFAATMLFLLLTLPRLNDRPHVLAYGCLAFMLFIAERMQDFHWRTWVILGITLVLWRNAHPSWPLGPIVMGTLLLDQCRQKRDRLLPSLFFLVIVTALVFILTPIPLAFHHYFSLHHEGAALPEWRPLFSLGEDLWRGYFISFFLFSAVLFWGIWRQRLRHPFYILVVVAMWGNAVLHNRFIPDAVLLGMPLIVESVPPFSLRLPVRSFLAASFVASLTVLTSLFYLKSYYGIHWGFGVDETQNPLYAARFLKEQKIGGNLFAAYWNTSDFLLAYLHPQVKVAVDIRVPGLYPFEFATRMWYISNEKDFRRYVLSLPLDYIVLGRPDPVSFQHHDEGMEEVLIRDGYDLVYFDRRYAVYRTPKGRERPEAQHMPAYRVLHRWWADQNRLADEISKGGEALFHDLALLKRQTERGDRFYRKVATDFLSSPLLSEEQRLQVAELCDASVP